MRSWSVGLGLAVGCAPPIQYQNELVVLSPSADPEPFEVTVSFVVDTQGPQWFYGFEPADEPGTVNWILNGGADHQAVPLVVGEDAVYDASTNAMFIDLPLRPRDQVEWTYRTTGERPHAR